MQLAVAVQKLLDDVLRDPKATINYQHDGRDPIPTIFYYIEQIRISLWDTAFFREFVVEKKVNKNKTIDKQYLFKPTLHRVLYRYFKYVIFPSKAISKFPHFFVNFLEKDVHWRDHEIMGFSALAAMWVVSWLPSFIGPFHLTYFFETPSYHISFALGFPRIPLTLRLRCLPVYGRPQNPRGNRGRRRLPFLIRFRRLLSRLGHRPSSLHQMLHLLQVHLDFLHQHRVLQYF